MSAPDLYDKCKVYLHTLCNEISDRSVGSEGNRRATRFFEQLISSSGWTTDIQTFAALDWKDGGACLQVDESKFQVFVSPYSLGCQARAPLCCVSSVEELAHIELRGKIVLLHGEIAKEQLMPKNFVFYNPETHQRIISLLEEGKPRAIICATGRNASLAGGVYPFPLIEDGDFDIPSVYMTEEEGARLLNFDGKTITLESTSRRIPSQGDNVIARMGHPSGERIVITAHIDAKKGTPGAIDNATGVVILLLLAGLLGDYQGNKLLEMVAFYGEDYYAVPGQMLYINQNRFDDILLNINIDGAGYKEGRSAFSFYSLPVEIEHKIRSVLAQHGGITEGAQWSQGDHSIFIQQGCPAIAVSSAWFTENVDSQEITHTPKDNLGIVDCQKLVEIVQALDLFIRLLSHG